MGRRFLRFDDTISFLIWDTARSITRALETRIAGSGVPIGALPFLRALWETDGQTQRELAVYLRRTGPTTIAAIRKLERAGFVRQADNLYDRRKVNVFLTAKGRKLYDTVMPEVDAIMRRTLIGFSSAERDQLKSMLGRYRDNLQQHPEFAESVVRGRRSEAISLPSRRDRSNGRRSPLRLRLAREQAV